MEKTGILGAQFRWLKEEEIKMSSAVTYDDQEGLHKLMKDTVCVCVNEAKIDSVSIGTLLEGRLDFLMEV